MNNDTERLSNAIENYSEKRFGNVRHLLLVSSTLLGILISFYSSSSQQGGHHLLFALGCLALSLGCIGFVLSLFYEVLARKRAKDDLVAELKRAAEKGEKAKLVVVGGSRPLLYAEYVAYALVAIAYGLLTAWVLWR